MVNQTRVTARSSDYFSIVLTKLNQTTTINPQACITDVIITQGRSELTRTGSLSDRNKVVETGEILYPEGPS